MKVKIISTMFAPAQILISSYSKVYKTIGIDEFEHYAINNHYPINKDLNNSLIKTLCNHFNIHLFDLKENVGLSGGFNYIFKEINPKDDDIIIALDSDVWPTVNGWGKALIDVISSNDEVAWASLMLHSAKNELISRGYTIHTIGGHICWEPTSPCINSICALPAKFLKSFGEIKEQNKYYGGVEVVSFPKIKSMGKKWVYLPEYREEWSEKVKGDDCYVIYKWEYAHKHSTKLDFESWLLEDPNRIDLKL